MKLKTLLVAAAGAAVGYVLGTRDGRERFEQLKARARRVTQDPAVQRNLANLADQAAHAAARVPGPTGPILRDAAERLNNSVATPSDRIGEPR